MFQDVVMLSDVVFPVVMHSIVEPVLFRPESVPAPAPKFFPPVPEPAPAPAPTSRPKLFFSQIRQQIKFFNILV